MKKITLLLILFLASTLGFSQSELSDYGVSSSTVMSQQRTTMQNIALGNCDQINVTPPTGVENGRGCNAANGWTVANDFIVTTGENAVLTSIVANILVDIGASIVSADVSLWDDAAGVPGVVQTIQAGIVPTSQPVVGSAFGRDLLAVTLDPTPIAMAGDVGMDTTYWISVQVVTSNGGAAFYEDNSVNVTGNFLAFNDGSGWFIPAVRDGVHTLVADCSIILPTPISECGNAPELIPAVGTSGPMNPSIATVATVGTVGVDYSIASVDLNLNHTFDADLDISLTSPNGIVLDLSSDNGGAGDNYIDTIFTDGAPNITTGSPPFTGMFEPEGGTLNGTFAGEPVNGNWTLDIFDDVGGDSGVLNSYCINFDPILGSPPVISCPADIMANTDPGACGAVASYAASAIDPDGNLDTLVQTVPDPNVLGSGDEFPVGTTAVTFRATDTFGNFSECTFNVIVTDNELPVAVCQDITVNLDPVTGMATIVPGDIDNGSSDNCGVSLAFASTPPTPFSLTTSFASNNGSAGNMFDVMPLTDITVNSFDVNNSSTTTVDYEIYFKTGTYVGSETNAGDWTLVGSALGVAGAGQDNPTALGLAMGVNLTAGNTYAFYVADIGPGTHRYINGGTAGDLWASDANLEVYEGAGKGGLFGATFSPRNFSGNVVYETPGSSFGGTFDCSNVGANVITLAVTDPSGNVTTCTSTVTVADVTAPEIVCIGEQLVGPNTVSDAPGIPIVDNTTFSTTINIAESFTITDLNMDIDIEHTWTGDITLTLESPAGTQVVVFDDLDGCSGDNMMDTYDDESVNPLDCQAGTGNAFPLDDYIPSNALSAFDGEDTAGTWTLFVEDDAGGDTGILNSWGITYDFAPIVGAPLEVDLDANGNATINASDLLLSVNEACGWTATVGGAPNPFTLLTTLAGGNGNFGNMFDVNALNDVTIDSFDIHGDTGATYDVEVYAKTGTYVGSETDPGAWTLIGTAPGVVSNGDGVVTPLNLALGYAMAAGETHAFYVTPTDFSTGGFNYTNGTTVGAVFASDANIEFLEGAGSGYPFNGTLFSPRVWNGNIQYSSGNGVSTTLDLDCSNLGENLIEVTVTDDSGNVATCMATVNVNDVTAPVLVCQDITLELGPDGTAVVDPMALLASLPGTYEVITISSDNQSGTPGETDLTVPITAADNISFDWDYSTMDGPAFDSFGYLLNGVYTELTDPAGANNQNGSAGPIAVAPGDVFGFRSASVDGVFGACTTVVSNFMPGFTGQFDPANWTETLNNSDGSATFVEIPGGPLSFDACGITVLAVDITEVTCADVGTPVTVTVFASDSSLNTAACVATITVVDLLAPVVTCPADITVDPGPGNLFYEVPDYFATGEATAEDNCTDPLTILTQDPAAGTLLPDGVYPVTMTAEDEFGNVGTCTFTLTIESVLGLDDNELDNAISMYPNPADSQVTISNSSNIQLEKAAIYDMNGKLIQQIDLSQMTGEQVIDVSYLSAGVYVVQIASDDSSAVKRLIKE